MNNNTFIQDKTRAFGVRVIKAYCEQRSVVHSRSKSLIWDELTTG